MGKQLRRKSDQVIKYTPMIPKTENGKTVLVKVGRPLTAANEHELRKKMQNRVSAIEARVRKKRRLEDLEERVEKLTKENETLRTENARLSFIDWGKPSTMKIEDKISKPSNCMPSFTPNVPSEAKAEPTDLPVTSSYQPYNHYSQPTYQAENYYPAGFQNPLYPQTTQTYNSVANQPVQASFTNPESLKSLLSSPQAPPVTVPAPNSTPSAQNYSTYTPRPTYDNREFDFASFMPSM